MKYFIGLSSTLHDPSLSIINEEGLVLFAESTERYLQYKRGTGSQVDTYNRIKFLIEKYCDIEGEFYISTSWSAKHLFILKILNRYAFLRKLIKKINHSFLSDSDYKWFLNLQLSANVIAGLNIEQILKNNFKNKNISWHRFDHHTSHAAYASLSSSFENAICLVVDGAGESGSISAFSFHKGTLKRIFTHRGTESLGGFYMLVTELCGFDSILGEEWKAMGLASYGKKNDFVYAQLKTLMHVRGLSLIWNKNASVEKVKNAILSLLKNEESSFQMKADIAFTGQQVFSELLLEILRNLFETNFSKNVILTGGVALNSSFNGTILSNTKFEKLYIPSAPADDGNSIGAAWLAYQKSSKQKYPKIHLPFSPYLGSEIDEEEMKRFIHFSGLKYWSGSNEQIIAKTAKYLSQNKIVAWVQGKAEFGPRALGNRSILADPRSNSIKERINNHVKFRESFRPFAPSILDGYGDLYFENYQDSPYMDRTLKFREEVIDSIPGVVHVDGTGRLQTVIQTLNPKFHALITEFQNITGVPLLLNTSYNIMGKPMVHTFADAISVFLSSDIDILVVNNYVFEKNEFDRNKNFQL